VSAGVRPYLRLAVDSGWLPATLAADRRAGDRPATRPVRSRAGFRRCCTATHQLKQRRQHAPPAPPWSTRPHTLDNPEVDLALVDYFQAGTRRAVFDGYRAVRPIDPGFAQRQDLWRLFGYLAVVTVAGSTAFGRTYLDGWPASSGTYR